MHSKNGAIRVLVGSQSNAVRADLQSLVRSNPSLEFAGTIDLLRLPQFDGAGDVLLIEADTDWTILADLPIPTVLLLDVSDRALVGSALASGIRGAIPLDATAEEIDAAIHAVHAGLVVTMPAALAELLPLAQPPGEALVEPLSNRELEVLDLLAEGLSNKVLAYRLGISEHTVKTHVASIFAKLGASSRTEAVARAVRRGLIML